MGTTSELIVHAIKKSFWFIIFFLFIFSFWKHNKLSLKVHFTTKYVNHIFPIKLGQKSKTIIKRVFPILPCPCLGEKPTSTFKSRTKSLCHSISCFKTSTQNICLFSCQEFLIMRNLALHNHCATVRMLSLSLREQVCKIKKFFFITLSQGIDLEVNLLSRSSRGLDW